MSDPGIEQNNEKQKIPGKSNDFRNQNKVPKLQSRFIAGLYF